MRDSVWEPRDRSWGVGRRARVLTARSGLVRDSTTPANASGDRAQKGEGTGYWSLGDSSRMDTGEGTGARGETGTGMRGEG